MPDGAYYLKIVATDAQSNPPAQALTVERESERFEVDNTPPVIDHLEATPATSRTGSLPAMQTVLIRFEAHDDATSIERAQYSVDGGDWTLVAPDHKISDSPKEHYQFSVPAGSAGEHTIAVRAYDRFENVGSAKTTFTITSVKP